MSQETSTSADGLGVFGSSGPGREAEEDDQMMRAAVNSIAKANGSATLVTQGTFDATMSRIYAKFSATSTPAKRLVDRTLTYYFAVHGTSPDTEWASYEYPITIEGRVVAPKAIVDDIGVHRLKKFMGRFTGLAIKMVSVSPDFRAALGERAARGNLQAGQEHLAIDFVGKDGSLSRAETQARVSSREASLAYRAHNAYNVSDMRAGARKAEATVGDARAARPLLSFDN